MTLRDPRYAAAARLCTFAAMVAGVALEASGPSTLIGLLPYFTIQSNIAYGIYAAWTAARARRGDLETSAPVKGAVTLYVAITGLVYHLVLANPASAFYAGPTHFTPAEAVGNQLLHTVVPLLAVLDWLVFDRRRRHYWRYALYWLAGPLAYLGFAVVRGLIEHTYPYPFLDVNDLGYGGLAVSAAGFAVAFWVLGLLFVLFDRIPVGRSRSVPALDSSNHLIDYRHIENR
jgi:hypothetical protein